MNNDDALMDWIFSLSYDDAFHLDYDDNGLGMTACFMWNDGQYL